MKRPPRTVIEYCANTPEEFERFRARVEPGWPEARVVREKAPTQAQLDHALGKHEERLLAMAARRKLPRAVPGARRRVRIPGFKPPT